MEEFYNTAIYNTTNTLKEGPMLEVQFILAALGIFGSMLVLVLLTDMPTFEVKKTRGLGAEPFTISSTLR